MSALGRRWRVIALVAACALAGTVAGVLLADREYTSTASLYIPAARVGANVGRDDLDYADRVTNTYQRITASASLRADVQRRLRTRADIDASAQPVPNTELMEVQVRAPQPGLARRAANAYADALVARVRARNQQTEADIRARVEGRLRTAEQALAQLQTQLNDVRDPSVRDQLTETLRLRQASYRALAQQSAIVDVAVGADRLPSVAERARISTAQTGSRMNIALGLLLGLVAGTGVAMLLERRAPQLVTLEDIERSADAPVLATVPIATDRQMLFEAFSEMRARLLSTGTTDTPGPSSLLIASPRDGDGKSLVAAHLAVALARAQRAVLLVDANLRRPSLHDAFELDNAFGLAELLQENLTGRAIGSFVQTTHVPNLSVLTSGSESASAGELLASPRMVNVMERLGRKHEFVIYDSPSLGTGSDATVLTTLADAVILVVGRTPASDKLLRSTRRQLQATGTRRVWVVVNRWRGRWSDIAARRAHYGAATLAPRLPRHSRPDDTDAQSQDQAVHDETVAGDHVRASPAEPGDRHAEDTKNGRAARATRPT